MKNWLKKVLSLLTAITLLVSAGVLAFAEETGEPIDNAAAEDAARKNAEEEAARQAAEEAARKAAEEAARKAAEEEARQAAEEEARKAAEEAAEAQNANTSEQMDESVPSINNEETSETEVPTDEDDDDSDGEIIEIDGWGYVDPEIIPEYLPEMTTEIKFPEAKELKLNQAVSGSVDAENKAEYILVCGSNMTVVLSLDASSEDMKVEINQKAVKLTKDETVTSGFAATCELNVIAGNEYNIVLTSSVPVSYKLIAKDANAPEEDFAEPDNDSDTEGDEQNKEDRHEQSGSGKPGVNINEGIDTTGEIEYSVNETAETEVPPMKGWISVNAGSYGIGDTVILKAESDSELGDMVAWQTKAGSEGSWKGAGYGSTLTVELTEENNNSAFRFRMEDGNYSEEYVLSAAEKQAEETEVAEETEETEETEKPEETEETEETEDIEETEETEETEATEETEETEDPEEAEDTEETEETEETEDPEEETEEETEEIPVPGATKIIVTAEDGADLYISADRESEVTGHLDTGAEIWVILNEEQTWGQICNEDEEAPVQFISMEDAAEVKYSEEAEEEAEEEEEAETEEPAEDEAGKMTAAGCTKIIVTAEEGADLYAEPDREAEVTGHLDAETEVWVSLNEEQTWGQLYNEDEEAAPQFISMEDAVTAETVYEEQMNGLGYRKVQVLNQNGTDIYDSPEEEASVIDHAEFESELWIRDFEAEGWAEIYTEEEIQKYVMLDEIGEQMPFDEEMLEAGYIKAYVAVDIGANVYGSIDGDDIVDHLDAGTELWVKLIDDADRALIFNMDEEAPATYINLVDIIATKKPEDMEDLPTREIVIHDVLKEFGMNVIFIGTEVPLEAELINFSEDDQYTVKWQYSENGKKFIDIPDANELTLTYVADKDNQDYIWKIVVSLVSAEE